HERDDPRRKDVIGFGELVVGHGDVRAVAEPFAGLGERHPAAGSVNSDRSAHLNQGSRCPEERGGHSVGATWASDFRATPHSSGPPTNLRSGFGVALLWRE